MESDKELFSSVENGDRTVPSVPEPSSMHPRTRCSRFSADSRRCNQRLASALSHTKIFVCNDGKAGSRVQNGPCCVEETLSTA